MLEAELGKSRVGARRPATMRLHPNAIIDGRSAICVAAARVDSWGTPRRGPEWVRGAGEKIPAPVVPARDKSGPIPGRLTPRGFADCPAKREYALSIASLGR